MIVTISSLFLLVSPLCVYISKYCSLVLPVFKLYVNGIIWCVHFGSGLFHPLMFHIVVISHCCTLE